MAGSPVRPVLSISTVLWQELPGAALPSPLRLPVLSRPVLYPLQADFSKCISELCVTLHLKSAGGFPLLSG